MRGCEVDLTTDGRTQWNKDGVAFFVAAGPAITLLINSAVTNKLCHHRHRNFPRRRWTAPEKW